MQLAPSLTNGYTLVPLRAVGELLNADVQWDASSRSVIINSK
ncbi:stalk domain-containing protein [Paenibacillus validus]